MGTRGFELGQAVEGGNQRSLGGRVALYLSTPDLDLHRPPCGGSQDQGQVKVLPKNIYTIHPIVFG